MRLYDIISLCFILALMYSNNIVAVENGRDLAQKVYNRDEGKTSYARVDMILIDKRGNKRTQSMLMATKNYGPVSKLYIRFLSPASIEGTAFLAWENEDRPNDQFLYLPALRRARRIAGNQKDRSFANSDLTYEDLEKRSVDADDHQLLRSERYEQYDCWVLESTAKPQNESQYRRLVSWIDKNSLVPLKVEYYDRRERLIKVLYAHHLEKIDGVWTEKESEIHDIQRDRRTILKILDIRYNRDIPDRIFTEHYLQNPG